MQEFKSLTRNKNEISLPWKLQLRCRGTNKFSINGNESVAGHGIRRWQEMDVDPSTKRIIPTKYISKTGIILYKWVLLVDYYTHVMVEMVWTEPWQSTASTTTNNITDRETINLLNSISTIKQNPVLSSLQAENPSPFSLGNAITQPLHHPSYYHLTRQTQNSLSVLKHLSIPKLFSLSLSLSLSLRFGFS
jgi:hypothetical protein